MSGQELRGTKRKTPESPTAGYASLATLPADLKAYISSFLVSKDRTPTQALNDLKSLARVNKAFYNFFASTNNLYTVLSMFALKFHKSVLELATMMKTPTSLALAEQLKKEALANYDEYLNATPRAHQSMLAYLTSLAGSDNPKATSYAYYFYYQPMYTPSVTRASNDAIKDNNFPVFKLLVNAGYFHLVSQRMLQSILEAARLNFLNYLIQNDLDVRHIKITYQRMVWTLLSYLRHVLLETAHQNSADYVNAWRAIEKRLVEIGADQ